MSKLCSHCGQTLRDQDVFCDRCGQSVGNTQQGRYNAQQPQFNGQQAQTAAEYATPMKPKQPKIKWWMIAAPAVLVVALVVVLMWNTIAFAIAPEAVLAASVAKAADKLADRMDGTPFGVMANTAESTKDGMYMAVNMDYSDDYTDDINVDAQMTMDLKNKRLQMNGSITAEGETVDAMFYMDAMCAAIGSNRLTGGAYYGITYETFSADLEQAFFYDDMDDETAEQMEMLVDMLQEYWTMLDQNEELANSEAYKAVLTEYYESMDMETGSEKIKIGGKERSCNTVTYTTTWGDFVDMYVDLLEVITEEPAYQSYMESYADYYSTMYGYEIDPDDMADSMIASFEELDDYMDGDITAVFYLRNNTLAAMDLILVMEAEGEEVEIMANVALGENIAKDDIEITIEADSDYESFEIEITCMKEVNGDTVSENIYMSADGSDLELEYVWNSKSGELELNLDVDGYSYSGDLIFLEAKDGFTITVEDLDDLMPSEYAGSGVDCAFSVTLAKGETVKTPAYNNIDTWTEDQIEDIADEIESIG